MATTTFDCGVCGFEILSSARHVLARQNRQGWHTPAIAMVTAMTAFHQTGENRRRDLFLAEFGPHIRLNTAAE